MNEIELNSFLTNDYIYIPYSDKDKINLRETGIIYKNDDLTEYENKRVFSPVSGKAFGLSEINSIEGPKKVLIIENDFKDKVQKRPISNNDIYEVDKEIIKDLTKEYSYKNYLTLKISYDDKFDISDEYLLKDKIIDILETLNIIDQTHENLNIKIRLDKRDIISYQTLFSYLGTYPNIEIEFTPSDNNETVVSLYDIIDIYDKLKNRIPRDYIYLTVKSNQNLQVIKTKKNSNLKDLLEHLNLMSTNIIINEKLKIENGNFFLDEKIRTININ